MRSAAGSHRLAVLALAVVLTASCAARLPPRPTGGATDSTEALALFARATSHCGELRTLSAELGLSGRAGEETLRGRVIVGLRRGGSARLEGLAPFGAPLFILAARDEQATVLLPRDRRVLVSASVAAVIDRLTGLPLGADDLLLALTGCAGGGGEAREGRQWPGGWRAVSVASERTVFLREQSGQWRVVAADGGGWRADYSDILNTYPRVVRLRSADGAVDLVARVRQLEVNTPIDEAAFEVTVPADAEPMTIDELRSVAPLRMP